MVFKIREKFEDCDIRNEKNNIDIETNDFYLDPLGSIHSVSIATQFVNQDLSFKLALPYVNNEHLVNGNG